MDSLSSLYDSLTNFHQISPLIQTHLNKVYLTLYCALVAWAVGAYLHLLWNIGGLLMAPTFLWYMFWFLWRRPIQQRKRVVLLITSAFLQGASIGPLIEFATGVHVQSLLVAAFVGIALEFWCFSAASMLSRRRKYIYLGALLSSGLSVRLWLRFASMIFGGSAALFQFELRSGLMVFMGYLVLETQNIIGRAEEGDLDYVKHCLDHLDVVAGFVRFVIFIIGLKNFIVNWRKKRRAD